MYESKTVDSPKKKVNVNGNSGEEKNGKLRELNNKFLLLAKFFLIKFFFSWEVTELYITDCKPSNAVIW